MINLYLHGTEQYNPFPSDVRISKTVYERCKIFVKYTHKPVKSIKLTTIRIYKEKSGRFDSYHYLDIRIFGEYENGLVTADVYFNKYENKTPLITVLNFERGSRLYTITKYDYDFRTKAKMNIYEIDIYDQNEFLIKLMQEDDKLPTILTFQIDNRTSFTLAGKHSVYNNNKIVVRDYNNKPELSDMDKKYRTELMDLTHFLNKKGYYVCKHEPLPPVRSNSACFLYKGDVFLWRKPSGELVEITEIQNQKYNLSLYYGSKVTEPLLLEFNQGGSSYNYKNKFYYHFADHKGLYWQVIEENVRVYGLQITYHYIYEQFKEYNRRKLVQLLELIESRIQQYLQKNRQGSRQHAKRLDQKPRSETASHTPPNVVKKEERAQPSKTQPKTPPKPQNQSHQIKQVKLIASPKSTQTVTPVPTFKQQASNEIMAQKETERQDKVVEPKPALEPPIPVKEPGNETLPEGTTGKHPETATEITDMDLDLIDDGSYDVSISSLSVLNSQVSPDHYYLSYQHQEQGSSKGSEINTGAVVGGTVGVMAVAGLSGGGFFFYQHFDSVRYKI